MAALSILVIHHRTPQLLETCLARLSHFAAPARVLVIDSGPPEETATLRPRLPPTADLLRVPNHSLAHALNCGLRTVTTPFVAHLNADVFVTAQTFPALLTALKPAEVAMTGPVARTPDGRRQHQGPGYALHYRRLETQKGSGSLPVPWLSGCLQVLKMEAVRAVGGMDASLRFYNEDMEWCFRLRRAGWRCHLVRTEVEHVGGASTPKDPRFLIEGYRGGYRLSQRYGSPLYRLLHRAFVLGQSALLRRYARRPDTRRAFGEIHEMFRGGHFDVSPFGTTLDADKGICEVAGMTL